MKVMVVEDEFLIAEFIIDVLSAAGHEVIGPASTVAQALACARAEAPELALLDVNLKRGENGTDLAHVLHCELAIPVLFDSGNMYDATSACDIALGHLAKPFPPPVLKEAVEVMEMLIRGSPPGDGLPTGLTLFAQSSR